MPRFFLLIVFLTCFSCSRASVRTPGISPVFWFAPGDTVPVAKAEGLFRRLLQSLRFRQNALAKEQKRVLAIIDSTGLRKAVDSLHGQLQASSSRSDSLIDELYKAIQDLRSQTARGGAAKAPSGDMTRGGGAAGASPTSAETGAAGAASADETPPGEGDLESLVTQLLPVLQGTAPGAETEAQRRERVAAVRDALLRPPGKIDTLVVSDTLERSYTVGIKRRIPIIGIYSWAKQNKVNALDYGLIGTLVYDGLYFKGSTGDFQLNEWNTAAAVGSAREKGCKVTLMLRGQDPENVGALLSHPAAQVKLIRNVIGLLAYRGADGVDIRFGALAPGTGDRFTAFISMLYDSLGAVGYPYTIDVVLPAFDAAHVYDLDALNPYVSRFLVDFTAPRTGGPLAAPRLGGPLAPLQGVVNNDIRTAVSIYLSAGISASKLVPVLPYWGVYYKTGAGGKGKPAAVFLSYDRIRSLYPVLPRYDPGTQSAYIDLPLPDSLAIPGKERDPAGRIWFDDEKTIAAKYDYILQMKLGGVAFEALGDDGYYGDLRNALMDKLVTADTAYVADIRIGPRRPANPFKGWKWNAAYLGAKYEQYYFLFAYPCVTDFPKVLKNRWTRAGITDLDRDSVDDEATGVFGIVTVVLLLLLLASIGYLAYQVRRLAKWKAKKWFAGLLILLSVLLLVSLFMYAFVTKSIIAFGTTANANDCFDFPLGTLFAFIVSGLATGSVISYFLVPLVFKKDNIP
jgi:hypothetical protein